MDATVRDEPDHREFRGLRVYCSGPIRGDVSFNHNYRSIIKEVAGLGCLPLTEITPADDPNRVDINISDHSNDRDIYNRDMDWLRSSHCVVAEVSAPSHGAGFEISYALFVMGIPVLALHCNLGNRLSAMLEGCDSPNLTVIHYSDKEDIKPHLIDFFHTVQKKRMDGK